MEGALAISDFQNLSLSKRGWVQNLSCENKFCLHENKKSLWSALNRALKQTRLTQCCHGNFVISHVKSNIIAEISRQNKRRCVTKFTGTRSAGTATKLNETCTRNPCTRVMAFLRISLFLERFWRKFRISFKSHKTVKKKKAYRPQNDNLCLLMTLRFTFWYLILRMLS